MTTEDLNTNTQEQQQALAPEDIVWAQIICPIPVDGLVKLCQITPPGARLRPGNQTFHEGAFHDVLEVIAAREAAQAHKIEDIANAQADVPDPKDQLIEMRNTEMLQLRKALQEEQLNKRQVIKQLAEADRRHEEQVAYIKQLESLAVQQPAVSGVRGWMKQLFGAKE